jgi:cell division protein FtsB
LSFALDFEFEFELDIRHLNRSFPYFVPSGWKFPLMKLIDRLPSFLKNKYVLTVLAFFVWLLFFDSNDLILQYQRNQELQELEQQKGYYKERIDESRAELKALSSDTSELIRFARERYLMKKPDEDIYVIVPEDQEGKERENLLEKP